MLSPEPVPETRVYRGSNFADSYTLLHPWSSHSTTVTHSCTPEARGSRPSTVLAATSAIGAGGAAAMPVEEADEAGAEVKGDA